MSSHTDTTAHPSDTTSLADDPRNRPKRARRTAATVAFAGLMLAAAACSSSDRDAAHDTTPAATSAATPRSTPTTTPPAPDVTARTPTPTAPSPPTTTSQATGESRRALLSSILESHHAAGDFVGARIALRDRDGTVTEVTSGTQTVDPASPPIDPDIAWNVGSVTKTFVALVVLQLADEGRVDLDAGIDRYMPELPGADRITPRELLQHTSGLAEYINQPAVVADPTRTWTPAELIAVAESAGRVGEPGGPHHYANTNYIILGQIIEQVTGHPWADAVNTMVVEPLGMTNTRQLGSDRPVGYEAVDGSFVDTTLKLDPSVGGAAGAIESTDHDLVLLATALRNGTLLSPASHAAMQSFVPGEDYSQFGITHGYGLGLEQYRTDKITVEGHMGSGEAQSAYVGYDRDHGTAIAVMLNTSNPGPQALIAVEALTAVSETA
jgi:D-alanyl-D-alanine carboxypeptidase